MKETRTGRPREFDIDEALDIAIDVFWSKGYDGASLTDLTEAMGITRPSLYAAFTDKRGLYLEAIDRYVSSEECPPLVEFDAHEDIGDAVRAFLSASIDYATARTKNKDEDGGQLGCFLGNCVSTNACEVEGVQDRLRHAIEETDKRLTARFELEKQRGVLAEDFPSKARARLMFDLRQGIALRARAGISARKIKSEIGELTRVILG